ncbi:MAG: FAD/NAD(P)-binding protein [Planctomycetota bacterium]|nr:FAD/NAD(P)-binding protein [Planctomycetota bacterium]
MERLKDTSGGAHPPSKLDWIIIGGGVHGVHIAVRLLSGGHATADRLRIVDPGPRLLVRWRARVAVTGMSFLRSPSMHHLDEDSYSLERFARVWPSPGADPFTRPNNRPSTELFDAHCDALIEAHGLEDAHVRDSALDVDPGEEDVVVELRRTGQLRASRVVLALGTGENLDWPDWAPRDDPRVAHIFDPALRPLDASTPKVAIIGGGISAAQVALDAAKRGHQVELICRHAIRSHQYDSDPGWFGPKNMRGFERVRSAETRRRLISTARNRGSLPADVEAALRAALADGSVRMQIAEVRSLERRPERVELTLADGQQVAAHRVLLATGFAGTRPGGQLVDRLVERSALPVAPCGFPLVDSALRWHPRVHVSGALAELEIGPIARNIAGARRAGDRIVSACR